MRVPSDSLPSAFLVLIKHGFSLDNCCLSVEWQKTANFKGLERSLARSLARLTYVTKHCSSKAMQLRLLCQLGNSRLDRVGGRKADPHSHIHSCTCIPREERFVAGHKATPRHSYPIPKDPIPVRQPTLGENFGIACALR